ncbi:MAG: hypothetical protein GQ477_04245 [Nanohaloarchaea archaeon]|nr:hypothetical protein [Candidatus Nanohaloarchaea archaeon]
MNPFSIIKKIRKIESINSDNPGYVENYFLSQTDFMKDEIIEYYAKKSCGQTPDICKTINIKKEYPIHISPEWSAQENYIILESIENDFLSTYNYNQLPQELQDEINQIYADRLMRFIEIHTSNNFNKTLNNIKIKNNLNQTAMLSLN